jgi:hypothetical protein
MSLALACVAVAATASSALAFENVPHYGRCVENSGGAYSTAGCTKINAKATKHYEWEPLATTIPFTAQKERNTGNALLETLDGTQAPACTGATETGEYGPGSQVKNVVIEFTGCKGGGAGCNSEGQKAEVIDTNKLHGEPGVVKEEVINEKNIDGVDLRSQESEFVAQFSCGPAPGELKGGIVVKAQADSTGGTTGEYTNKMANKVEVEFATAGTGVQDPQEWTPNGSGVSNVKRERISEHLEAKLFHPSVEGASLSMTMLQGTTGSKPKIELRQCEKTISCPN